MPLEVEALHYPPLAHHRPNSCNQEKGISDRLHDQADFFQHYLRTPDGRESTSSGHCRSLRSSVYLVCFGRSNSVRLSRPLTPLQRWNYPGRLDADAYFIPDAGHYLQHLMQMRAHGVPRGLPPSHCGSRRGSPVAAERRRPVFGEAHPFRQEGEDGRVLLLP